MCRSHLLSLHGLDSAMELRPSSLSFQEASKNLLSAQEQADDEPPNDRESAVGKDWAARMWLCWPKGS
ncbi:MAG: hypothetical protein JOZ71_10120 [Ktedonobacteraceae bacterium]|nr:hypothetical protein [Ktedonobacteraceae bacterium]